jgi:hypothetical protein
MSTEPKDVSPELRRCFKLLSAAFREPNDEKARELIEQSGHAFVDDVRARTREKLVVLDTLIAAADGAINAAEAAELNGDAVERNRQLGLFDLYFGAAERERTDLQRRRG